VTGWQWGASGNAGYTQSYNNDGSIATLTNKDNASAVNYSLTYAYDKDGRITLVTRHNGTKDAYTYDAVNRLISESRTTGTAATYSISYTYDKNGNRLTLNATGQHMQPAASAAYIYAANTNKLASFTKGGVAQTFSHTANSELSYGTYLPTYDYSGRRKVDRASTDYYFMNYNHKNERSFRDKVVNGAVSTMTQYIYDEQSHLIGEYDKTGALVEYVWMGDKPVAAIYGSGAATKIYYIVTDHLNTPRRLVDGVTHAVVWSWDSTAFGVGNPTGSITFNLRFPGQYYDVGTNQFYNHNRFYNPELGRYMEPDPIGLEGGLNPYAYAGSNPVMNVDSSGLFLETILDIGLAGYSIKAAYDNPSWQNILAASYDTTAVVVPFLPAGAGVGVKAYKGINTTEDIAKTVTKIPPTVQNRINIANNATKSTPLRNTGEPVSAGFNHVLDGHFNRSIANNRSIFTIEPSELKSILQNKNTISSPVSSIPGGQFTRVVDTGKIVGNASINQGGQATTFIKIFTDSKGNLITVYPVRGVR
ncbi:RHS repeat-associated core domain-containing protein, partial [Acinetobacter baumannii]